MKSTPSAARIAAFAFVLIALGFALGFGFQSLQYANLQRGKTSNNSTDGEKSDVAGKKNPAPVVRALRVSPDDRLLAFNATYGAAKGSSLQAGRFIFDLKTYNWNEGKSPNGWQDSIAQWSRDGKKILFARERIPRAPGEGEAGLYEEPIALPPKKTAEKSAAKSEKNQRQSTPQALSKGVEPSGEKAYAGFWTPDGRLVMKTRRESKSLFLKAGEKAQIVDRSPATYYQNRAVLESGVLAYYVVRDISIADGTVGLFRVANGKARQVGSTLADVVWVYIAENARWMIVCRYAENGSDWQWSLYRVSPTQSILAQQATIPQDVVAVYWSPDFKQILGAAGKSLWLIDVPSLKSRKLGEREDWNADDAAWLTRQNAAIVASAGHLWKVDMASGKRSEVWKFPQQYWR